MKALLTKIRSCTECAADLQDGPRPVLQADPAARIVIIGQAPGARVHESGVLWQDASGRLLRRWMGIEEATFYDAKQIALVPMGFCYPGKGMSGDLPPRSECEPLWQARVLKAMKHLQLTILIGQYAQGHYLSDGAKENLTETVRAFRDYAPDTVPLPHPSPRNRFWLVKNPWFEKTVLPVLRKQVDSALA